MNNTQIRNALRRIRQQLLEDTNKHHEQHEARFTEYGNSCLKIPTSTMNSTQIRNALRRTRQQLEQLKVLPLPLNSVEYTEYTMP